MADTHAVVLSTSRLFHNYRHAANALLVYDAVRRLGLPDSRIVLMLAGSIPCEPRHSRRPSMHASTSRDIDLYPRDIEVDYKQEEVTVENFLGVLTDRQPDRRMLSANKRLRSGPRSRLLLYMSGHGGDPFLKFNDQFELPAADLANALADAFSLGRFAEVLVLIDTCQASTITAALHQPPAFWRLLGDDEESQPPLVASLASSKAAENSFSHEIDPHLGVAVSDRFTYQMHTYLRQYASGEAKGGGGGKASRARLSVADLQAHLVRHGRLLSTVVAGASGGGRILSNWSDDDGGEDAMGQVLRAMRLRSYFGASGAAPTQLSKAVHGRAKAQRRRSRTYAHWEAAESRVLWGDVPIAGRDAALLQPPVAVVDDGMAGLAAVAAMLGVTLAWLSRRK